MLIKDPSLKFNHVISQDLVLYPFVTEQQLEDMARFKTHPGDVFLLSYPKTGTFWLAEIVYNLAHPQGPTEDTPRIHTIPLLEYIPYEQVETYPSTRYVKTHYPYEMIPKNPEQNLKYIYISRNPRDVLVSLYHHMCGALEYEWTGTWDELFEYFLAGKVPFGCFFDHVLPWWKERNNDNVLFIKFEDLKKDLKSGVRQVAEFLGFEISEAELESVAQNCTFEAMKARPETNLDQYPEHFKPGTSFLRKGIVGDWKNYFSEEQLQAFDQWYNSHIQGSDLKFEFTIE
jgi:hypothetical protein